MSSMHNHGRIPSRTRIYPRSFASPSAVVCEQSKVYYARAAQSKKVSSAPYYLADEPTIEKHFKLEHYFDDLYHRFLYKFAQINYISAISRKEKEELEMLLHELLRVKTLLEDRPGDPHRS